MGSLLAAGALQACGSAAVAVTVPALVRDLFEKDDYARVMGLVMLVMALAPLVATSIGGLIILYASWRWVFIALFGITLMAGLLFFHLVDETLPVEGRHPMGLARIRANDWRLLTHRTAFDSDKLLQAGLAVQGLAALSLIGLAIVSERIVAGSSMCGFGMIFRRRGGSDALGIFVRAPLYMELVQSGGLSSTPGRSLHHLAKIRAQIHIGTEDMPG